MKTKKNFSIVSLFLIFGMIVAPIGVSASEISSNNSIEESFEVEVENSEASESKKEEMIDLIEGSNGTIIETSDVVKEGVKEYEQLSTTEKSIFSDNVDSLIKFSEDNIEYEEGVPKIIDVTGAKTSSWEVYELDNDIVVEFPGFKTYLVDNEYVDVKEPVINERASAYKYLYSRNTTNKEWLQAIDTISQAGFLIGWKVKSPTLGAISGTASFFSWVGQKLYKTIYIKVAVYQSETCPFKGKNINSYYQFNNYSGKKLRADNTVYTDNTNYYQRCIN